MSDLRFIRAESRDESKSFLSLDIVNAEIALVITHTFNDTQLPIELDCLFLDKEDSLLIHTNVTLRGCFNYRTKFHTSLWNGHSHLGIFEFENRIPEVINSLATNENNKRWDPTLIICDKKDASECKMMLNKSRGEFEKFMKENNSHIWEANRKEEEEYKRKRK